MTMDFAPGEEIAGLQETGDFIAPDKIEVKR
jgi:hypothetical protein